MHKKVYMLYVMGVWLISCFSLSAQSVKLEGKVVDATSGEGLELSNVYIKQLKTGDLTDSEGRFSFAVQPGVYTLEVSYVGYVNQKQKVEVSEDTQLKIKLKPEDVEFLTVQIEAESYKDEVKSTQMGRMKLTVEEIKKLPVLFGEVDPLKTIQLLPGIQAGNEGTAGFFVRGGSTDQNLVLMDDVPLYYPSHLMGLLSVFNGDVVEEVEAYKGGFPAQYGGRLSSVIDIKQREGSHEKFGVQGGLGLLASRLTLETPFAKKKGSFLISGRRTYFDVFTRAINKATEGNENAQQIPNYNFYDLNARADYRLGENDHLRFSAYYGNDALRLFPSESMGIEVDYELDWGNTGLGLTWKHIFKDNLYAETYVHHTAFRYKLHSFSPDFNFEVATKIRDFAVGTRFFYQPNDKHTVRFGTEGIHHIFNPQSISSQASQFNFILETGQQIPTQELSAFVSDDWEMNHWLSVHLGLRGSAYHARGRWYQNLEPRFASRILLTETASIKFAATRMNQYVHQVSNSSVGLPIDLWYPATDRTPPQASDQLSTGFSTTLFGGRLLLTNEYFYKWLHRQVEYKEGIPLFMNEDFESDFTVGKGRSYGTEILLKKDAGKLTGWVGYTLAWTWRQFEDKNNGIAYPYRNDRRHDVSVVASYALSDRVDLSGTWVYSTGSAVTLPTGEMVFAGIWRWDIQNIPDYTSRNGFRTPAYHRGDVAVNWELRPKRGESSLNFSVYNVYNHLNTFFIHLKKIRTVDGVVLEREARKVTLFPVLPSVTWNFKF